MAKNVQADTRDAFYKALDRYSLFEVIEAILVREEEEKRKGGAQATLVEEVSPPIAASQPMINSGGDSAHNWLWLICTDIISNICIHDASLFRTYLISSFDSPNSILSMVFTLMSSRHLTTSLAHQLSCLIRLVLDPEAMSIQDQYLFLGRIYEEHLVKLLEPLRAMQPSRPDENPFSSREVMFSQTTNPLQLLRESQARQTARDQAQIGYHIAAYHAIELLSYCALHHNAPPSEGLDGPVEPPPNSNYFRNFAVKHNVLPLVMNLLRTTRRNDLVCSAIRFFRICLGNRDAFYTEIILAHHLFEPILMHFAANGARYNLLNSVVCEMMFFFNETHRAGDKNSSLRNYNPNSIRFLECLVHQYWTRYGLDKITYVGTFQESKCLVEEWERMRGRREEMERNQHHLQQQNASSSSSSRNERGERKSNGATARMIPDDDSDMPMYGEGGHRGPRTAISRTMRAVLADEEEEEEDGQEVGGRRGNKFTVRTGGGHSSGTSKHRLITKRRKTHQKPPPQLLADEYYAEEHAVDAQADLDRAFHHANTSSPDSSSGGGNPLLHAEHNTDSPATDDSFEEFEVTHSPSSSLGSDSMGEGDGMSSSPEPSETLGGNAQRRIVFVSEQGGEVQRQLLPQPTSSGRRRSSSGGSSGKATMHKRKHEEEAEHAVEEFDEASGESTSKAFSASESSGITLTPAAASSRLPMHSPPAAASSTMFSSPPSHRASPPVLQHQPLSPRLHSSSASPPVPHHSPQKSSSHNPYAHVLASELPPTAARSPEMKGHVMPMPLTATSKPSSPPRQISMLDLADIEDDRTHQQEERLAASSGQSSSIAGMFTQQSSSPARSHSGGLLGNLNSPPPQSSTERIHPGLLHSPPHSSPNGKKAHGNASNTILSALHTSSPPLLPLQTQQDEPPMKRRRLDAST